MDYDHDAYKYLPSNGARYHPKLSQLIRRAVDEVKEDFVQSWPVDLVGNAKTGRMGRVLCACCLEYEIATYDFGIYDKLISPKMQDIARREDGAYGADFAPLRWVWRPNEEEIQAYSPIRSSRAYLSRGNFVPRWTVSEYPI